MYLVRITNPTFPGTIEVATAAEALEIARPQEEAGNSPTVEAKGTDYSFAEFKTRVANGEIGDDA